MQRSYSSFTLRWGGIIILLFVIYHLLHFTWQVDHPGRGLAQPVRAGRQRLPGLVGGAVLHVAMIAVGFHLRHGTWSALTTLGANTSAAARRRLNLARVRRGRLVTIGFLLPPFGILLGLVK